MLFFSKIIEERDVVRHLLKHYVSEFQKQDANQLNYSLIERVAANYLSAVKGYNIVAGRNNGFAKLSETNIHEDMIRDAILTANGRRYPTDGQLVFHV